jgi:phosphohistidine phosphatase SixA
MPSGTPDESTSRRWLRGVIFVMCLTATLFVAASESACTIQGEKKPNGGYPNTVLIIRHAEKPAEKIGVPPDPHLTSRGAARAAALPSLFAIAPTFPTTPARFATPDYVYAASKSDKSNRSVETAAPLAKALKLKVDSRFHNKEFAELAHEILAGKQAGRTVLVCWHQGNLPKLAESLADAAPNRKVLRKAIPNDWDDAIFDRVWVLRYEADGAATFADEPQRLLFGDAEK